MSKFYKRLLVTFLVIATIPLFAAIWLNHQIFSPPRRAIQSYHLTRLNHPDRYGLKIRQFNCLDTKISCLLVEPNAQAGAGKRGKILRQQIAKKGITLNKYGKIRGIIILLHGRNSRKEDLLPVAERFVAAGFRCLIPDLPAHGDSTISAMAFGSDNLEASLPRLILNNTRQHFNLPKEPAALWGISMGGAFALRAASESPKSWDALLVVSSFSSLNKVLGRQLSNKWKRVEPAIYFYLDLAQWLQGRSRLSTINPQEWAKQVRTPTLIVHGEKDHFIPPAQGKALFNAINTKKKRWITVPNARHSNVLSTAMPLYAEMNSWLINTL
jgi:pimeloyl-ACP methyl ester carboxylesterase